MSCGVMKTAVEALTCKSAALRIEKADGGAPYRKTPLLNRVYQTRSCLMPKLVASGLKATEHNSNAGRMSQLLILGVGLDTSYNTYCDRTFAVDFAEVIEQQAANHVDGRSVNLVVGDLRQSDVVLDDLLKVGFDPSIPTVILLECVLSYVDPVAAQTLLSALTMRLANATLIMYDPVLPFQNAHSAGLAVMMHLKFEERGAPLLSCARSVEEYGNNLRQTGWKHVTALSVNQAAQLFLSAAERKASVLSEPFDEFASLAMLQNYYAVGVASTNEGVFQRLHEILLAGKESHVEREQAVLDRIVLVETRLKSIESHQLQRSLSAPRSQHSTSKFGVSIRPARVTDTHTLVQVYQSAFESASQKYTSVKKYVKFSLKALKEFEKTYLSEQRSVLFVAQADDGAVVGCIGVKMKQLTSETAVGLAELSHFCVSQDHQRGGVGQALLNQAVIYCQEQLGPKAAVSLTVLRDLEAARRLYASKGFEHVNTEKLGNDCELYHLRLSL